MDRLFQKIPIVRLLVRAVAKRNIQKAWRKKNAHNETKVGSRYFPLDIVQVGKGSYGTITIQTWYATSTERLFIGNYVSIAPDVTFMLGVNHQIDTATTFPFYSKLVHRSPVDAVNKGPIIIEDEVWIGTGVMIFSGITIGKGAVIAAGAVVTKHVPPYAIVGGNPAKLIRFRFSEEIINILKPLHFADIPEQQIRDNIELIYKKIQTIEDALRIKAFFDENKHRKND